MLYETHVWLADAVVLITQEVAKNNLPFSTEELTSQRCSKDFSNMFV